MEQPARESSVGWAKVRGVGNWGGPQYVEEHGMSVGDEDEPLIEACRAGETAAFGELVRRYQDRLYPTLYRLTGSAEDASDLLQDAFFRAYQKLGRYRGGSSFYTWLYRLAVNLAISDRRKRRVRPVVRLSDLRPDGGMESSEPIDRTDPTLPVELAERDARIHRALNELAPDHRAVVVMKDFDGLRYDEIAAVLGVPVGTVRSRLHRARNELRERLRDVLDVQVVGDAESGAG